MGEETVWDLGTASEKQKRFFMARTAFVAYGGAKPLARWIFSGASVSVQDNLAMLAGMCFFVALNYIGQRFFVFKEKDD